MRHCATCESELTYTGRGRPPTYCPTCKPRAANPYWRRDVRPGRRTVIAKSCTGCRDLLPPDRFRPSYQECDDCQRGKREATAVSDRASATHRNAAWTSDEWALVAETLDQPPGDVARLLGRSRKAVDAARQIVKGKQPAHRYTRSPRVEASQRLVARTCLLCGELRDAADFGALFNGSRRSRCKDCLRVESLEQHRRKQGATVDTAHRRGQQWTGPELELATRSDLSVVQAALMLGRTACGVSGARHRVRHEPIKAYVAGVSRRERMAG